MSKPIHKQENNSFVVSRWIGVATNLLNIGSGIVFEQFIRLYGGVQNLSGNLLGIYASYCEKKHKTEPINSAPTQEQAAETITLKDIQKCLATNVVVRNWVSHLPRVTGSLTSVASGLAYDRAGEAAGAALFAMISAIPLLKFEDSYKAKAAIGIPASIAITCAGIQAKDPLQILNGLLNLAYFITQANVPNAVGETTHVDRVLEAKLKHMLQPNSGINLKS